jgi:hypothetical protein
MAEEQPQTEMDANRTNSFKLPEFWKDETELWFIQLDHVFATAKITNSKLKYQHAITALDKSTLKCVRDLIVNPGLTPYETLRERLIQEYSATSAEKVRELLQTARLGDQKPSQFLRHLKNLAGGMATDELLKSLWLRALPLRTQEILAVVAYAELEDLAKLADQTFEVTRSSPSHRQLAEMSVQPPSITPLTTQPSAPIIAATTVASPPLHGDTLLIVEELRELRKQINALTVSISRLHKRSNSRGRVNSQDKGPICFPHRRYGDAAYACKPPCTYKQKNADA